MLFLDYAASQEEAVEMYHASDMVLAFHSDDLYLSEPGACCRAGEHFSYQMMPPCQQRMALC